MAESKPDLTKPVVFPLRLVGEAGVWTSRDGRWTFMRTRSVDDGSLRWFAYKDGDGSPANVGMGHTTLRDAAQWVEDGHYAA